MKEKIPNPIPKYSKHDLPFERPKYDASYAELVHYTEVNQRKVKGKKKRRYEIEKTNKHVCFSGLKMTGNVKQYTNIRVDFSRTALTDLEVLKWFDYLNTAYRRELFVVDLYTRFVHIHFGRLHKSHRTEWGQLLNIYGLVRYLYEEGKPMVARGALYLKDKRPNSDFMHCITASDIMVYNRHLDQGRHSGHSIYDHSVGSTVSFHLFKLRLKKSHWINNAVKDNREMPKCKYMGWSRARREVVMDEKFKCNFDSHTPLTIIKKWHQLFEDWDLKNGKPLKEKQKKDRLKRNNNNNNPFGYARW